MNMKLGISGPAGVSGLSGVLKCAMPATVALFAALAGSGAAQADAAAGAVLYGSYCQGCHNALASSTKKGATSARIQSGITNVAAMSGLSSLTATQIKDIACALGSTADCTAAPTPTPVPTGPTPTPGPTTAPTPTPAPATSGEALYAGNCQSCHGPLATTSRRGSSARKIQEAIKENEGGMGVLSGLSSAQIKAIACALGSSRDCSSTPTPTPRPTSAPTPRPTTAPTPTPNPNPTCGPQSRPELDTVPSQFDATVGQQLQFSVSALDCNDDAIVIKAQGLPKGATLTQRFDTTSRKQVATVQWVPGAGQAGKRYRVTFTAKIGTQASSYDSLEVESEKSSAQTSVSRTTTIRVWSAKAKSQDISLVDAVVIRQAQWQSQRGQLAVSGTIKFGESATKADRENLTANPLTIRDEATQEVIDQVTVDVSGKWSAKIPLSEVAVPCSVTVEFDGDTGSRAVKRAPAQCGN